MPSVRADDNALRATGSALLFVVLFNLGWHFSGVFEVAPHVSAFYVPPAMSLTLSAIFGIRAIPLVVLSLLVCDFPRESFFLVEALDLHQTLRHSLVYGIAGAVLRTSILARDHTGSVRQVQAFIATAIGASLLSALWAMALFRYFEVIPGGVDAEVFFSFWAGDASGIVMFAPLLFPLLQAYRKESLWRELRQFDFRFWVGSAALPLVGGIACFSAILQFEGQSHLHYLLIVLVAWIGSRYGAIGGALSALATNFGAIAAYELIGKQPYQPLELQVLFATMAITGLLIGASVDERSRLERSRFERESVLARVARAKTAGEISSAISHELNSSLQAAMIHLGIARSRVSESPPGEETELAASLEKAHSMIESAASVQAGIKDFLLGNPSSTRRLSLTDLVESTLGIYAPIAAADRVQINFRRPRPQCLIEGNELELQHALINILDNARNALAQAEDAGTRAETGMILVSLDPGEDNRCTLIIQDTGPGFSQQALEMGFTSFFTTRTDGMGMGLSISRSIIEAHDGSIALANDPRGARVMIELPTAGEEA